MNLLNGHNFLYELLFPSNITYLLKGNCFVYELLLHRKVTNLLNCHSFAYKLLSSDIVPSVHIECGEVHVGSGHNIMIPAHSICLHLQGAERQNVQL